MRNLGRLAELIRVVTYGAALACAGAVLLTGAGVVVFVRGWVRETAAAGKR